MRAAYLHIQHVQMQSQHRIPKPEPQLFKICLCKLGCSPIKSASENKLLNSLWLNHTQMCTDACFNQPSSPFLSFPSSNLYSKKESMTVKCRCCKCTACSLTEKQLVALCRQLRCLPASNGTHETDGEPLGCKNDPDICMCTQTHSKHSTSHRRQTTLWWRNTQHSSGVATCTYTHQGDLSTGGRATLLHLCLQASAENVLEQHICPQLNTCVR